jgi:hypothetical protein
VSGVSTIEYGDHGYDAKSYDDLASQYHLIFEDWELGGTPRSSASSILQDKCGLATAARVFCPSTLEPHTPCSDRLAGDTKLPAEIRHLLTG